MPYAVACVEGGIASSKVGCLDGLADVGGAEGAHGVVGIDGGVFTKGCVLGDGGELGWGGHGD